jgi:K+-sensing histidine kinase KdpD
MRSDSRHGQIRWLLASWGAVAAVTALYVLWLGTPNHTTAALSYLLVVLVVAALSTLRIAIGAAVLAFLCFNFFFFPPLGTFRIYHGEDWITLFTLLVVSIIASHLSARARRQAQEAMAQRDELSRLLDERARLLKEREDAEVVRRSNELKSALLAALSHDLRTPLTAVTIAANNLKESWPSEEQRREQTEIVLVELARLNRLFHNLVEMARIEINGVAAEREWVQPAEIVEAAVRQVEPALERDRVELEVTPENMLVRLDPRLTSAALAQLLDNAAHYSPPSSPIAVQVALSAAEVRFAVRDHGTGIASEDLDHVFERFYRGRSKEHHRFGTGIGLAITRGLVTAQSGHVAAENTPGGGSVFTITIPTESRSAPEVEEQSV